MPAAKPGPAPTVAPQVDHAFPWIGTPPQDRIDSWIAEADAILRESGVPAGKINPEHIRTIIEHESNGNPVAANDWDSNASAGTPSKGVMQTIEPTFEAYAVQGRTDIWNPVDNIVAATRYSIERYGSVSNVPGILSKESGGNYEGY